MTGIFDGHNIEDRSTPLIKLTDDVVTEINCAERREEINDRIDDTNDRIDDTNDRIDDLAGDIADNYVTLATVQTIPGQKTFTNSVFVNSQNFQTQDQFIRINQGAVNIGDFSAGVEIWNPNRPIANQPEGSWMRVLYSSTLNRYALYLEDSPGAFAYAQEFAYLSDIAAALTNYYTKTEIDAMIGDINDAINDAITEMVNNYYTKQEIDNFFSNFNPGGGTGTGGGGIFAMGEGNFRNGNIANEKTTVTLIPAAPSADYYVSITPDEDTLAEVGEFWVDTANQNENGFDVYNTGLGITGFKWAVTLRSLPTIGGIVKSGVWSFAGAPNHVKAVGIGMDMPDLNYSVTITPLGDASTQAYVGEYWLGERRLNSFDVHNSGNGNSEFLWQVSIAGGLNLNMQAGGDLVGTFPNPTVAKIQNIPVDVTGIEDGNALVYDAANNKFVPGEGGGGTTPAVPFLSQNFGAGSHTVTIPNGVTEIRVKGSAGGGGAGGSLIAAPGGYSVSSVGGAGGGGQYCDEWVTVEVVPNMVLNISVGGAGGQGLDSHITPLAGTHGGATILSGAGDFALIGGNPGSAAAVHNQMNTGGIATPTEGLKKGGGAGGNSATFTTFATNGGSSAAATGGQAGDSAVPYDSSFGLSCKGGAGGGASYYRGQDGASIVYNGADNYSVVSGSNASGSAGGFGGGIGGMMIYNFLNLAGSDLYNSYGWIKNPSAGTGFIIIEWGY